MENKLNSESFKIEQLNPEFYNDALLFIENIFHNEQNIPKELLPLDNCNQKWWCIRTNEEIVGTVAAWEIKNEWHWGRLAIDTKMRGLGLAKRIAMKSLEELFQSDIKKVFIDARDITVHMVLKMGGKITGKKTKFYDHPITPMTIHKKDYITKMKTQT